MPQGVRHSASSRKTRYPRKSRHFNLDSGMVWARTKAQGHKESKGKRSLGNPPIHPAGPLDFLPETYVNRLPLPALVALCEASNVLSRFILERIMGTTEGREHTEKERPLICENL